MNEFRNIFLPHAERFYRAAYYMLGSPQDAEDAVQELYLRLWKNYGSMKDLRSPVSYGMSLLKNICIDMIRRREVRKTGEPDIGITSEEAPPEIRMDRRNLLQRLMTEMEKLPSKQSAIIKMVAIEGLSYSEISERTGLSQIYIRVLVSTARKTLKRKMNL